MKELVAAGANLDPLDKVLTQPAAATASVSLALVVMMRSKELKTSRSILMLMLRFSRTYMPVMSQRVVCANLILGFLVYLSWIIGLLKEFSLALVFRLKKNQKVELTLESNCFEGLDSFNLSVS